MIKRLQIKIILVVVGTLFIVFAAVLIILNLSVFQTSVQRADNFLNYVAENDGFPAPPFDAPMPMPDRNRPDRLPNADMMRGGRFFYAKIDHKGDVFEDNLSLMFRYDAEVVQRFISPVMRSGKERGDFESFRFLVSEKPYGKIIVFIERSIDILLIERLNFISFWTAGIAGLILLFLSVFLGKWIVAPVKNSFDRQRRFISDASHELKTPLTIISANVDVLKNEIGEHQRLTHIKSQTDRMSGLVHDLLTLAGTDEGHTNVIRSRFSISDAVLNTALEFESRAYEENKVYSYDIDENIEYTGDERQIKQLVTILIDNAIRYSDDEGTIGVALRAEGGHVRIYVYNTGDGVPDGERDKIFERFYRTDESRSRETGGYGVGLSIAKAIIDAHKGKVAVTGKYMEWIRFDVTL